MELSRLLTEHGVDVYKLNKKTILNGVVYEPGAFVVPLSQPFRPFIKEVMEVQEYPVRHFNIGGEIIKPYDVTSWSLPLHKGVRCEEIKVRHEELEKNLIAWNPGDEKINDFGNTTSVLVNINNNASYKAAFMASAAGLKVQRLAEDIQVEKTRVKKGSFLISSNGSGNTKSLNEIIKSGNNLSVLVKDTKAFKLVDFAVPRIGVVESWFDDVDAGWTRFVLDDYRIQFKVLRPEDFEKVELEKEYDVLVFPSMNADNLMKGRSASAYPPGFTKGIGEKGFEKILKFLEKGGKIISWGESTGLFMGTLKIKHAEDTEEFILPLQDISSALKSKGLYCPGSFVNINLRIDHPLTLGMQDQIGVFYRGQPVFTTKEPQFDMDRRVIATFPEKDVLRSGYIENGELLGNKSAMVWLKKGKGQVVLFAFNPQFRASTPVSYKLLFNALLLKEAEGY